MVLAEASTYMGRDPLEIRVFRGNDSPLERETTAEN